MIKLSSVSLNHLLVHFPYSFQIQNFILYLPLIFVDFSCESTFFLKCCSISCHRHVIPLQITSTLTFAAACASAGITVLIDNDLGVCGQNHCVEFQTATCMSFISWFAALPSFLLNFWSLASRWTKRKRNNIEAFGLCESRPCWFDLSCLLWFAKPKYSNLVVFHHMYIPCILKVVNVGIRSHWKW